METSGGESSKEEIIDILPFFPKNDCEVICQEKLRVTWFEPDFSQSRYNFEKKVSGSNACTIIAILVASYCNKQKIQMHGPEKRVNYYIIKALAQAMLDGNSIHNDLKEDGILTNINLTIPEAIKFSGKRVSGIKEWKSMLYMQPLVSSLYNNLNINWNEWTESSHGKRHPDLYIVLICDSRSILFVIQNALETVTLIDSHQHTTSKGALVASVSFKNLKCLCKWITHVMLKYYHSTPKLYELSFLYFRKKKKYLI